MRKRLIHKGNPRYSEKLQVTDGVWACDGSLQILHPLVSKRWAGVTCPKCLKRQVWGKKKSQKST